MLITLSGLPGSGTSTVARTVSSRLSVEHLDGGTVFRDMASERGLSLGEFASQAEADDTIDRALDDRLVTRARQGDVLLESRLAGWLVTRGHVPALRVWISCDDSERARRVGDRDGHDLDEALATNTEREASERLRYQTYYDIDLADLSIYDLIVDSTNNPPDQVISQILAAVPAHS